MIWPTGWIWPADSPHRLFRPMGQKGWASLWKFDPEMVSKYMLSPGSMRGLQQADNSCVMDPLMCNCLYSRDHSLSFSELISLVIVPSSQRAKNKGKGCIEEIIK